MNKLLTNRGKVIEQTRLMDRKGDGIMGIGRRGQERRKVMEKGRGKGTDTLPTDNVLTRKEYIEREAAKSKSFRYRLSNGELSPPVIFANSLDAIPAADVVPVVRAEFVRCGDGKSVPFMCAHCGKTVPANLVEIWGANYCPNCGADMRGEQDV